MEFLPSFILAYKCISLLKRKHFYTIIPVILMIITTDINNTFILLTYYELIKLYYLYIQIYFIVCTLFTYRYIAT
jgi:hypothetical protein